MFEIFISKLILDSARECRILGQPYYQDYISVDDNQKGYRVIEAHQEGYNHNQGDYRASNNQPEGFNEEDNVEYYELGARPKYNTAVHSQVIH